MFRGSEAPRGWKQEAEAGNSAHSWEVLLQVTWRLSGLQCCSTRDSGPREGNRGSEKDVQGYHQGQLEAISKGEGGLETASSIFAPGAKQKQGTDPNLVQSSVAEHPSSLCR